MIYWIENMTDGSFMAGASTYEEALRVQHELWTEKNIDTYIRKEE